MQFAVQVACLLKARVESALLLGAGAVMLGSAAAHGRIGSRFGAAALGSVLAFAGLTF